MLSLKKRQALLAAGFSAEELERILDGLSKDATASGRECKEKAPPIVGGRSFVSDAVNRLLAGESFKRLSE